MTTGFKTLTPLGVKEAFKGFFISTPSSSLQRKKFHLGENSWKDRCKHFDKMLELHPLAKSMAMTIAGQLTADGVFVEKTNTKTPHEQRAEEAAELCRDLNKAIGMKTIIHQTSINMSKWGSCFWEQTFTPKFDVRIHPYQECIEPAEQEPTEGVTVWRQNDGYTEVARYQANKDLIHFPWNVTSNSYPYGTSLYVGLETEFDILEQLEIDIKEHMHHTAFPKELWQVGNGEFMPPPGDVASIRSDVRKWEPGESFVTSYPIKREAGGTGDKTISNLSEVLNFVKDQLIDGTMVPPISKQWSSTMASAQEMMPWCRANLIQPMQTIISYIIERYVYQPYIMDYGFSVKLTPEFKWEAPDAHKDEEAEYWALQVQSGIVPPEYAAMEQGFDMEKIKQMRNEQLKREAEQMQYAKQDFGVNPKQGIKQKVKKEERIKEIMTQRESVPKEIEQRILKMLNENAESD